MAIRNVNRNTEALMARILLGRPCGHLRRPGRTDLRVREALDVLKESRLAMVHACRRRGSAKLSYYRAGVSKFPHNAHSRSSKEKDF